MKKLFYVLLITAFIVMCLIIRYKDLYCSVLEVNGANSFVIDLNHNKSVDEEELVVIDGIKVVSDNNLSDKEQFIFEQLAKNWAEEFFFNKKVRFTGNDVIVNGESYLKHFNSSGFNREAAPQKYEEIIRDIKGSVYYVLNLHNMRYHKYGCSHYLRSENYKVYKVEDLPIKAIPCSYCNKELRAKYKAKNKELKASEGSVKLFVTDYTKQLIPQRTCSSNICRELLSQINRAQETIDMAIYGYNSVPEIEAAITSAINRGVKIRLIYDLNSKGETEYSDSKRLGNLVGSFSNDYNSDEQKNGRYSNIIMHNKFYIFDEKVVVTGSANLSPNDMSGYSGNSTLTIYSPKVAKVYKREFEQMYSGKFHGLKAKSFENREMKVGDSVVSVYFSPQDRITKNYIVPLINKAQKKILMPAFLITDKLLAESLIAAHNRGVEVRLIIDATSATSPYSQIEKLRASGVSVKVENYAGKLHSKSIIIDDKISVIGSMNFSNSGQNYNDENVVIIENSFIAELYGQYFESLWLKISSKWLKQTPRAEGKESIGSCKDGVDNDYDGLIDSADEGCK